MTSPSQQDDSARYRARKAFFDSLLTVYGRKPVLEALQDAAARPYRLHLSESNRPSRLLDEILELARDQGADIRYHDRKRLARISGNGRQDQGVAVDLECRGYRPLAQWLADKPPASHRLLALDRITNPQNLGMIIRAACAGDVQGIVIPERGCAPLDSLVIKASAGTLFRAPILRCTTLLEGLGALREHGDRLCALSSHAETLLGEQAPEGGRVYVLGNETDGVSPEVARLCDQSVRIPMGGGVESLNVAVTAGLIAFQPWLGVGDSARRSGADSSEPRPARRS